MTRVFYSHVSQKSEKTQIRIEKYKGNKDFNIFFAYFFKQILRSLYLRRKNQGNLRRWPFRLREFKLEAVYFLSISMSIRNLFFKVRQGHLKNGMFMLALQIYYLLLSNVKY